jgi:hypothetical protein
MGFSAKQVHALRRQPNDRNIRTREARGRELSYLEGWYAISEANRIFGFDWWNRETVESKCVLARESKGTFLAVYIARVRVTVYADGATVIREGHGTGEGHGTSPGEVHDIALKVAETEPPNGRWQPSESHSALNSIAAAGRHLLKSPCPHRRPSPSRPTLVSGFIRTIRPLFHGHPATMAVTRTWSPKIGRKVDVNWNADPRLAPRLFQSHRASFQGKSTRAFSQLPSPNVFATNPI